MDLDLPINTVLRACDIDLESIKLSKDLRLGLTQICTTAISFVTFLAEKQGKSGKKIISTADVVRAASRLEIPGLDRELREFLQSENHAKTTERFNTKNPANVLLLKKVQEAAIDRFSSLDIPDSLGFNFDFLTETKALDKDALDPTE
ncbi:hypothetical protein GL50803_0013164 [Giardia duodenalis]|uniref:Uncharacterized protein n=2 Tax=Giardia intestinalis TaxID=5741 RepID=D3KG99_GIAIC|nr:hypothetical protein GL50803_0013164 [Giardia intestinalis]KAE8303838.1 hypothetical protein GL50803_0013164 [Giardia intestinalis]